MLPAAVETCNNLAGQQRPKPHPLRRCGALLLLSNALVFTPAVARVGAGDATRKLGPERHHLPAGRRQDLDRSGVGALIRNSLPKLHW